jgi:competence protein ComEC
LQPRYALVSAGWKNRFSHPAPSVVARWQSFGADVVNTAVAGAIHIDASGVLTRWRQAHVYPWRQGAPVVE